MLNTLIKQKAYKQAKTIGVYMAMPNKEIMTDPLVRHAFAEGKRVFIPYLYKNEDPQYGKGRVMDMVALHNLKDYESLREDGWKIRSLRGEQMEGREKILDSQSKTSLDLILMPAVAFGKDEETGRIRRLGHGKGFYDLFLDRYYRSIKVQPTRSYPLLCGLALEKQFPPPTLGREIPMGPLDQLVDALLVSDEKCVVQVVGQMEKRSNIEMQVFRQTERTSDIEMQVVGQMELTSNIEK